MRSSSLLLALPITVLLAGCGGTTIALPVSVADKNSTPIQGAAVTASGTTISATTDASGNARLSGFKSGIYKVIASKDGYVSVFMDVTINPTGQPSPVAMTLPYAPPSGMWIYHPGTAVWEILTITSGNPFQGSVHSFEWDCYSSAGGWYGQEGAVSFDPGSDTVTTSGTQGANADLQIIGPAQAASANDETDGWTPKSAATVPDFTSNVAPSDTC